MIVGHTNAHQVSTTGQINARAISTYRSVSIASNLFDVTLFVALSVGVGALPARAKQLALVSSANNSLESVRLADLSGDFQRQRGNLAQTDKWPALEEEATN